MEALSAAASVLAIVSLSVQLIQSVALIKEFAQDIKGASKELARLMAKLELLKELLEDVRTMSEQQSLLQDLHFPAPSRVILRCLQSCQDSIQPLVDIVMKSITSQAQLSSATARIRSEVKLGLKSKQIAALETRIQQDVDALSASLALNSNFML